MNIYDTLNPEQRRAVEHERGPLLILAGAGSGKTRVLTHRIAYLIEECNVSPYQIMAITFTNKAAKEMRERVDKIVEYGAENIWVSTFHSSCVRMLRRFIETIGYSRNFTIYDTDDQKTLMREICKYLSIDTKQTKERVFLSAISSAKNELISPEEYELKAVGDFVKQNYAKVYKEYQKRLKASNALDFDDLIFKTVELFQSNEAALSYFQNRFRFIMVDEYQDTNTAQFKLISLLSSSVNEFGETEHNLCVVGDDDQSIYKFRGANIRNILDFEKEYPDAKIIKLEQNYRSTKNILNAANEVITNNLGRKDKSLWTDNPEGEAIAFTQYETDYEEASFIASDIYEKKESLNLNYSDFAILYRTNAQSRVLEEKLIMKSIPYKIIGSINFYQRKEIKDLLCYLKTIDNGLSELSVKRIINVPKRGIGLASIEKVESYAERHGMNFYNALLHAEQIDGLGRTGSKITSFISFIESMKSNLSKGGYSLKRLMEEIIEGTGYLSELEAAAESEDEINDRRGNIDELINKIAVYEEASPDIPTLSGFLEEVALVADTDSLENEGNAIVLMTLHSAKGLEFPYVYLCGMEDGIFPSHMSINADNPELEIEEERRLCYVGITRAMKYLSLSAAKVRMNRGEAQYNRISRFINEIPRYLLSHKNAPKRTHLAPEGSYGFSPVRMAGERPNAPTAGMKTMRGASKPAYSSISANPYSLPAKQFGSSSLTAPDYSIGDSVVHIKFGTGTVKDIVRGGRDYEITVDFGATGVKKMLSSFAKLKKVE